MGRSLVGMPEIKKKKEIEERGGGLTPIRGGGTSGEGAGCKKNKMTDGEETNFQGRKEGNSRPRKKKVQRKAGKRKNNPLLRARTARLKDNKKKTSEKNVRKLENGPGEGNCCSGQGNKLTR